MSSRIVLASASPRRRELLEQIGLKFEVFPSLVSEEGQHLPPGEWAEHLAVCKAKDVAAVLSGTGYVIGADTLVVLDGVVYGKPADDQDACRMLTNLQGRKHEVITGIAVVRMQDGAVRAGYETTAVEMRELTLREINTYVETTEPMDKAGAYAIQGRGAVFIPKICGCYFNVVGLPLARLAAMLEDLGWSADHV
jgi:septum formation protein